MSSFSLYEKTTTFNGVYLLFMVNRMQMLYYPFILPSVLGEPWMIWIILSLGVLSQVNMWLLSKWFSSDYSSKGYQGFVQLFGKWTVRVVACVGVFFIFIKLLVATLGYVEIIHQVIFPSMNPKWLILFLFMVCSYVSSLGMENSLRFVVITFLSTIWIVFLFLPFLFPPMASLHDLYPLIPTKGSNFSWYICLFVWSALSGPEYLIFLGPWINSNQKMLKYLTIGNVLTVIESSLMFVASLLFFGTNYLKKVLFPVIDIGRYIQSPVLERIDMILLCFEMFLFVYAIAMYILWIYGVVRILLGRGEKQTHWFGFISCCLAILVVMMFAQHWFWNEGSAQSSLPNIQIWLNGISYTFMPLFLFMVVKRKGRMHG
jgi:hypothetical protein